VAKLAYFVVDKIGHGVYNVIRYPQGPLRLYGTYLYGTP